MEVSITRRQWLEKGKATGAASITHVFFSRSMSGTAFPASFTFYLLLSKIHISNSSQKELQAEECNQIFKCDSPTGPSVKVSNEDRIFTLFKHLIQKHDF